MKGYTFGLLGILLPGFIYAWTAPTAAPPGNNVSAPVNIGVADQFKSGVLGANLVNIVGSSQYLNFGNTTGASGFGIRNNGGTLEYKNSGGSWSTLGLPTTINAGGYGSTAGNFNAYRMEVGGPSPTATNGNATIFFHHHGTRAHQLRYTNGILYLEAAGNGYGSSTSPGLTVGGGVLMQVRLAVQVGSFLQAITVALDQQRISPKVFGQRVVTLGFMELDM